MNKDLSYILSNKIALDKMKLFCSEVPQTVSYLFVSSNELLSLSNEILIYNSCKIKHKKLYKVSKIRPLSRPFHQLFPNNIHLIGSTHFTVTGLFLYSLKTSENFCFSDVFEGIKRDQWIKQVNSL